ncbi:MAG TPA: c-type cytochrome [Ignavibacteriaceae bacterium]|nr:c-type cytochrome [Ignavibacteriaceae bacterium]
MDCKFFSKIALLLIIPSVLAAQVPDKFTNLKILPKTISKEDLLKVMRSFSEGLGARCDFCHAENKLKANSMDYASDDKTPKLVARIMLNMTNDINKNDLSKLNDFDKFKDDIVEVKCITCHHGVTIPETLSQVLMDVIKTQGAEEAVNTYHKLYDQYYGGFSYNFKDNSLAELTQMLIQDKNYDAAMKFSNLNVEMYPKSGLAYFALGQTYEAAGDKAKAIENIKKALELSPGNMFFSRKLQELQSSN